MIHQSPYIIKLPTYIVCAAVLSLGCMETQVEDGVTEDSMNEGSGPSRMIEPLPESAPPSAGFDTMVEAGYEAGGEAGYEAGGEAGSELMIVEEAGMSINEPSPGMGGTEPDPDPDPEPMGGTEPDPEPMGGTEPDPDPEPDEEFPLYALEMLELVNQFRGQGGACGGSPLPSVPPLNLNSSLNLAAYLHAEDMATLDYFDHNSQDGRSPWDRIADVGYQGRAYGENIAAGNAAASATFEQWRNSPGHCSNMLSANFTELGVGYVANTSSSYRHYWVQKFAHPQ